MEWLAIWGVAKAAGFVFRPILEDLAKDVAKDAAKSYVGKCFQSVFSVIHRNPLTRATGLALKELLELIQNEMLDADLDHEQLQDWINDVHRFTEHDNVRQAIASLFLDPDYQLDLKTFAATWQQLEDVHSLPDEFSWQRIEKRFARKVVDIRQSSKELQQTFTSLSQERMSDDIRELAGLPPDFNLETYREALIERFGNLNFEMLDTTGAYYSGVRLWSVFVPQSVRECQEYYPQLLEIPKEHQKRLLEKGELDQAETPETEKMLDVRRRQYFSQPLRPVLEVTDEQSFQRTIILGDPGSGKSSLLRYLALRWAQIEDANLRYTQPLPLLIELRDYNRWQCPRGKSFARYLQNAPTWHRLNQITLDHLLKQPDRVALLLDGLDEIFDPVRRDKVLNDIHRFSNQYPETRIIVTSRVVGYKPQRLRDADFRHLMLQDLSLQQIDDFIDRWHDVTFDDATDAGIKRERLRKAIRDSKPIAMLAGNPLLLTMMAILNRNQKLPDDRVDLYQQATRVLLQQWDTERALIDFPGLSSEIGLREKTDILRRVAFTMQSEPAGLAGNIIDEQTLANLIEDYLHEELHFAKAKAVTRAVIEQLRVRNFILCFMGADSYAFVHRTFLEYFCAAEFVHQFNITKTLDIDGLIALFDQHCRDDDWREVLRLICGQINYVFVGRIVEHLATRTDLEEWDGDSSLPELPLAIHCLSEVRSTGHLEPAGAEILEKTIEVARSAGPTGKAAPFLMDQLLPACRELGERWPGRATLGKRGRLVLDVVVPYGWGEDFWPHLIAFVSANRDSVEELALTTQGTGDGMYYRAAALQALSEKWPDETTRNLLSQRALQDEHPVPRSAAFQALAEKWPDEATHNLLTKCAVKDEDEDSRSVALQALAEKWPDKTTRKLLSERAVQDKDGGPRSVALQALAEKWLDEATRNLLTERSVKDKDGGPRSAALWALTEKWPDETTRNLLTERSVKDKDGGPRSAALQVLADKWPDETTRNLLTERSVKDKYGGLRSTALKALSDKWPDEATRKLLTERAVKDEDEDSRSAALQALADKWPDETTRKLLTERAVKDEDEDSRSAALQALADNWPDETTRKLLAERAVKDKDSAPRRAAFRALAKKWPDEATRKLLAERAVQDENGDTREGALQALAKQWPDETTRKLLAERAVQDENGDTREGALRALAKQWPDETTRKLLAERARIDGIVASLFGGQHSKFGRILFTEDLDGRSPYLDPREPISREHIKKAASKAGVKKDEINETVRSLSEHLGWDITKGSKTD